MKQGATTGFRPEVLTRLLPTLALVVAPQLPRLPVWLIVVCLGFGCWSYFTHTRSIKPPGWFLRLLLSVVLLLAVLKYYGTLLGRDAGAGLLIAMLSLKLMEIREARDIYVVVFLGYFLIIIGFLFSQNPLMALYMLGAVTVLTAVLNDLNRPRATAITVNLRLAGTMLMWALPLAVVMFILFPRIGGPLWGLPKDAFSGMSGLSDEMAPGQISHLSQSDAVAFRATFDGTIPPPRERYWRGPVLWNTDGMRWSGGQAWTGMGTHQPLPFTQSGSPVTYTITQEASNQHWLFALDVADSVPPSARIAPDYVLFNDQPIRERLRYTVTSYPEGVITHFDASEKRRALQLPPDGDPQARALAQRWRSLFSAPEKIVQQALLMYRNQPFVYTLQPPRINHDFVDTFLFDTRRGFCEHYAASFTFLMRAAGIPARVVTGYQGGEINPIGNYLIVRQRDAHAWSEVWIDGRGWVRVDPTAAVAPERIEHSIDTATQELGDAVRFDLSQATWLGSLWQDTLLGLDALNNKWNQWVLSYGPDQQANLLSQLSFGGLSWRTTSILLLATLSTILIGVVIQSLQKERLHRDPAALAYKRFCTKLARLGLTRRAHEGPDDYATRIVAQRPDLAGPIQSITRLYVALRYGAHPPPPALEQLRRAVRRFSP